MATPTDSWREQILKEFTPHVAKLTLVADPDNLLTEELLLLDIQARGFELFHFEDPITFRFAYESKYRDRIEGGDLSLVVILTEHELRLPYDLLQIGRQLSFSLQDLFPNLSYPVVKALDSSDLESLYQAQKQYISGELGDNATKDFVLRYVFNIAPEFINQTSDLLLIILRRHYRGQRLPATLDERLIQLLRERQLFSDWPLETIIPDQQACFAFLQAKWPQFVRRQLNKSQRAYSPTGAYIISSPTDLPFDHEDVRVYIDNLFLEGYLQPIKVDDMGVSTARLNLPEWVAVGLQIDPKADQQRRLEGLLQFGETNLPGPEVRHQEWLTFARTWEVGAVGGFPDLRQPTVQNLLSCYRK